ncbi:cobalamin biosynthesis protein [Rhodomicrobium sp. Az07]|uniref:cobalamin biosynthesis protein n=1 Tax=Rhodomicrobium sp. Az07 TaxID=2839034 RepID=UPI001BE61BFC|nr:cobalamin biosynthesis protein [Rhodomicrobium sp. Az07]MBT3070411.1 cobalamin biosynthesis protein [Rhodomicrobium sp. Az07]
MTDRATIVAGLGFRKNAGADAIVDAVAAALEAAGVQAASLGALATLADKAAEPGFLEAAQRFRLRVALVSEADLAEASAGALTVSARVMAEKGVPSVAEAAALAAAGPGARLLGPRVTNREAACAIAKGETE